MMEKIDKGHPLSQSTDFVAQNIETLKTLFPTIVKEGKIDIKELQALLGDDVETEEEYYRFTWAGKSMARREANKPSTATLRPDKESSKDWDTTQNIFIEGDNLEVLKLLQKSYANKIKMIYIDPPYNTGKDFVYKDNYNDNLGNYLAITGQVDEEGKRISTNSESDGRYHSNWLNMMYPRLKLARNLMSEDALIFASIDRNEAFNLKRVLDEIFGEDNFVESYFWESTFRPDNSSKIFRKNAEFVLCYARNLKEVKQLVGHKSGSDGLPSLTKNSMNESVLTFPIDSVTTLLSDGTYIKGKRDSGYELLNDVNFVDGKNSNEFSLKGRVIWGQEYLNRELENGTEIIIKSDGFVPYSKKNSVSLLAPNTLIPKELVSDVLSGRSEVTGMFNTAVFDYPKPVSLLKYLISFQEVNDSIVLDFFAGSGTTAHALMQLNSEDAGNRKFICVQLPEPTDEKSEAYRAGYKTISEITKERIRRAGDSIVKGKLLMVNEKKAALEKLENDGKLIKDEEAIGALREEINNLQISIKNLDIGFRAFKLDSSNIRAWDGNPDALEVNLFNAGSNIKENRTEEDVLYEILLKYGLDLTMPIEQKAISDKQVFNIGMGALFICLGDNITTAVAEGIGKWKEELMPATAKVIFKDTGFTDVEKTNSMQILKRFGILEVNTI